MKNTNITRSWSLFEEARDLLSHINEGTSASTGVSLSDVIQIMKLATLQQLTSECSQIRSNMERITELYEGDASLTTVAAQISNIDYTLKRTLGSSETGLALESIAMLPDKLYNIDVSLEELPGRLR